MSAMTGSSDAPGDIDEGVEPVDIAMPDHLVVWLRGHIHTGDDQVVDDGRLDGDFSISVWVDEVRDAYPDSIVGAVFPPRPMMGRAADPSWDDRWESLIRTAAGVDVIGDERTFTGDTTPTSLGALRRWALARLEDRAFPVDDVVLALSELSTNVERHCGGWLTVDLVDRGEVVVLAVTDPEHQRIPVPKNVGPDDVSGRGLLVVAALSARWGFVVRPTYKTVWAAFPSGDYAPPLVAGS